VKEEKNTDIFPKHFFWGASSAAHQIEGYTDNQWTVWELEHAHELARTAHRRLSWLPSWERVKSQSEEPENYVSGNGVDHYNRYEEDFDLLKQLNLNAFRFSIEWSRLEPEEGKWNQKEFAHYKSYILALRDRKIEPFLTLWHWTLPKWFVEKGGFEKRENVKYFTRFVKKVADQLISDVEYVITLNEANMYTSFGYILAEWPPQRRSPWLAYKVYRNLIKAHKDSYDVLKKTKPGLQVGASPNLVNIQAKRPHNSIDNLTTQIMRRSWNWWFLNRIRNQQDFIGLNYYFTDYYTGLGKRINPSIPVNDMGFYMEPEGIYPILLRTWARFKKPIFITENGLADEKDQWRQWWIEETIVAMERALSEGVDIRGYLHWSLLDNFEWSTGWWPKFGLIAVDREHNMKRTIRPSARWFAKKLEDIQE
jgi:beta-glucosidase